jgi:ABC-type multidrug transport system ATPase subunit
MVKQAELGRTIISTIHQPSSDIFNIFHRLILLCDGNIIYQGVSKDSTQYFAAIPYAPFDEKEFVCPTYSNPADFFMEKMHVEKRNEKTEEETLRFQKFNDHYEASLEAVNAEKTKEDLPELTKAGKKKAETGFCYQLMLLLLRSFRHSMRNPIMTKVKFG